MTNSAERNSFLRGCVRHCQINSWYDARSTKCSANEFLELVRRTRSISFQDLDDARQALELAQLRVEELIMIERLAQSKADQNEMVEGWHAGMRDLVVVLREMSR